MRRFRRESEGRRAAPNFSVEARPGSAATEADERPVPPADVPTVAGASDAALTADGPIDLAAAWDVSPLAEGIDLRPPRFDTSAAQPPAPASVVMDEELAVRIVDELVDLRRAVERLSDQVASLTGPTRLVPPEERAS